MNYDHLQLQLCQNDFQGNEYENITIESQNKAYRIVIGGKCLCAIACNS